MRLLASQPNIVSKLSALGTFIHKNDPDHIAAVVRETIDIFGPTRCLFGSNFPVEKLWTGYSDLIAAYRKAIEPLGDDVARAAFRDTAARVYRLDTTRGRAIPSREESMALEIKVLDYGDIELKIEFLVLGRDCGRVRRVPVFGFLVLGGTWPVVVDTGYRSNQIMETLGMRGLQSHETMIENQLKKHGLRMGDVRYVLHTHLHIDHAGKDDLFPMNTAVVLNRKELEYSVSGLMHPQYPAVDIKHLIDRLHTKGALRFLDLEISGPVELMPGLICEAAGGHTEGSMNIIVKTNEGDATICGDVLYDINDQLVEPFREISDMEPRVTGNHGTTKRQEKAAIKKVVARSRFVLPIHDRAAMIEAGQVVGRLQDSIPGPIVQSLPRRNWFPA